MNTATSTPDEQPQCPRCGTPLVIDPEIMRRNCLNCGFREEPAMATLAYAQSIAANIADLAKLEKELAQLRADNKVLARKLLMCFRFASRFSRFVSGEVDAAIGRANKESA